MMDPAYLTIVRPLSADDGGGYLAWVPDLPGCMSDGETADEAVSNVTEAIKDWIDEAQRLGREIPEPGASMRAAVEFHNKTAALLSAQERLIKRQEKVIKHQDEDLKRAKDEIRQIKSALDKRLDDPEEARWTWFIDRQQRAMVIPRSRSKPALVN